MTMQNAAEGLPQCHIVAYLLIKAKPPQPHPRLFSHLDKG